MAECLNCKEEVHGSFCANCGQKTSAKRFELKAILKDIPHTLFHIDKGLLRNISSIRHPQKTIERYIKGERVGYFSPFFFFALTLGLILFIEHSMHKNAEFIFEMEWGDEMVDGGPLVTSYVKYVLLFSSILFALPTWLFFGKATGYNYAENVIANIFILGYANILYLLMIPISLAGKYPVNIFFFIFQLTFLTIVFNRTNWILTLGKSLLVLVVQAALFIGTEIVLAYINLFVHLMFSK